LQNELQQAVREAPARMASVYVQDIGSGLVAAANPDYQHLAASLIKLPVMGAVYEKWEAAPERKTRITRTWMEWMITVSDNGSTDRLIDLVNGPEVVTRFCSERGWDRLKVRHAILNHRGRRGLNQCTAREVGEFMAALDRRELVNEQADEEMWQVLCRSKKLLRIPAGVPDAPEFQVGNKTGTLSNALHDAAIVRTPRAHYSVCILLTRPRGEARGNRFCKEISRRIFDTLHGPAEATQAVAVHEQ
ncbi:MAG: serine hydrolase, partial [Actinomycetota bacterium]